MSGAGCAAGVVAGAPPPFSVTLTAPNGGETYDINESTSITWSVVGTFATFDLELSINNGSDWSSIATDIDGGETSYAWTVPGDVDSEQCLVRITGNVSGVARTDVSDAAFTIETPALPSLVTGSNCELWCEARNAAFTTDGETETITTQPDTSNSGGTSPLPSTGASDFTRAAGTKPYDGSSTAELSRAATADMRSAASNGDHSFVLRCTTGKTRYFDGDHEIYFQVTATNVIYHRSGTGVGTRTTTVAHGQTGKHTYGVSHDLSDGGFGTNRFYVDGVLLDTDSTHPATGFAPAGSGTQYVSGPAGTHSTAGHFVGQLSAPSHEALHDYLAIVAP